MDGGVSRHGDTPRHRDVICRKRYLFRIRQPCRPVHRRIPTVYQAEDAVVVPFEQIQFQPGRAVRCGGCRFVEESVFETVCRDLNRTDGIGVGDQRPGRRPFDRDEPAGEFRSFFHPARCEQTHHAEHEGSEKHDRQGVVQHVPAYGRRGLSIVCRHVYVFKVLLH